jgi:hypothetical protein
MKKRSNQTQRALERRKRPKSKLKKHRHFIASFEGQNNALIQNYEL